MLSSPPVRAAAAVPDDGSRLCSFSTSTIRLCVTEVIFWSCISSPFYCYHAVIAGPPSHHRAAIATAKLAAKPRSINRYPVATREVFPSAYTPFP